jgi:carbon storage regulator
MIGEGIEVVVLEVRGEQVRLGIKAPRDVTVHRKEIFEQILEENVEASQVKPEDVPG